MKPPHVDAALGRPADEESVPVRSHPNVRLRSILSRFDGDFRSERDPVRVDESRIEILGRSDTGIRPREKHDVLAVNPSCCERRRSSGLRLLSKSVQEDRGGQIAPVAILIDPIEDELDSSGMDRRILVVAVVPSLATVEPVPIEVAEVRTVAVLIDAIVRDIPRPRKPLRVRIVAIDGRWPAITVFIDKSGTSTSPAPFARTARPAISGVPPSVTPGTVLVDSVPGKVIRTGKNRGIRVIAVEPRGPTILVLVDVPLTRSGIISAPDRENAYHQTQPERSKTAHTARLPRGPRFRHPRTKETLLRRAWKSTEGFAPYFRHSSGSSQLPVQACARVRRLRWSAVPE